MLPHGGARRRYRRRRGSRFAARHGITERLGQLLRGGAEIFFGNRALPTGADPRINITVGIELHITQHSRFGVWAISHLSGLVFIWLQHAGMKFEAERLT